VVEYSSALQDSLLISWCGFVHIATINQNHHLHRIYCLKARNQKCFATHTPLRCRSALEPVDKFAPPAPPLPRDGGGLHKNVSLEVVVRSEEPWGMEVCCFYENHGATPTSQKQHHPQHRPGPSSSNQDLRVFFRISLKRPIPYLLSAISQNQFIIHSSDYQLSSKSYNWRARSRMRCARLGNSLDGAVERGSWECFSCKTSYMFRCPDANLSRLESRLPQLSRLAT
jgi:hypothetical protein